MDICLDLGQMAASLIVIAGPCYSISTLALLTIKLLILSPKKKKKKKHLKGFSGGSVVKNSLVKAGDTGDMGSTPGSGTSPGGGNGNPPQHSFLRNPMDRGAWQATVHGIAKCWTSLSTHTLDIKNLCQA